MRVRTGRRGIWLRALAGVGTITLLVSGCGSTTNSSGTGGGGADSKQGDAGGEAAGPDWAADVAPLNPPVDVKIGAVLALSGAGLAIGIENGYFKELGLNVTLTRFQNLGQLAGPLAVGQIDVGGGSSGPGLWNTAARGAAIKAVATQGGTAPGNSYSGMYVAKGSSIQGCKDAKGKTLAFAAEINAGVHTADVWLQSCGLSLADVQKKIMPFSDMASALQSGSIDIAHMTDPAAQIAVKQGIARELLKDSAIRETQQGILEFSPQFVARKDVANRFILAYARAIEYFNENWEPGQPPSPELAKLFVEQEMVKDASVLDHAEPPLLQPYGEMNVDALHSDYDYFVSKGTIQKGVSFEDAVDTSFTDFAKEHLVK